MSGGHWGSSLHAVLVPASWHNLRPNSLDSILLLLCKFKTTTPSRRSSNNKRRLSLKTKNIKMAELWLFLGLCFPLSERQFWGWVSIREPLEPPSRRWKLRQDGKLRWRHIFWNHIYFPCNPLGHSHFKSDNDFTWLHPRGKGVGHDNAGRPEWEGGRRRAGSFTRVSFVVIRGRFSTRASW